MVPGRARCSFPMPPWSHRSARRGLCPPSALRRRPSRSRLPRRASLLRPYLPRRPKRPHRRSSQPLPRSRPLLPFPGTARVPHRPSQRSRLHRGCFERADPSCRRATSQLRTSSFSSSSSRMDASNRSRSRPHRARSSSRPPLPQRAPGSSSQRDAVPSPWHRAYASVSISICRCFAAPARHPTRRLPQERRLHHLPLPPMCTTTAVRTTATRTSR